ncbi:aminoglycoside phosphotransferase family protein [Phytoactinopolyspora halotolerans]|uniref:Streptomycin 6-kinase n=1 Tax=Phytoactinopolyspora halotolerans TaxID=1981512 RepID=A0A6L9S851_9ACTN|nr:aminoglycoside phosphotransferase family protein [Phytoactinopolyspora halotolerans]NEE01217.1 hypothetical protein [Phytoactinopolyspora halotolerans]
MSAYDTAADAVSDHFRTGLESVYGSVGRKWLAELAPLLESLCARWELELTDLTPLHGYLSLVWRVTHRSESLALKVAVPSAAFSRETAGLLAWDGCAMVRLERRDVELGAALLQWLDASVSLADVPIGEAIDAAGRMLAVTPVVERSSASVYEDARVQAVTSARRWTRSNREFGDPLSPHAIRAGEAALGRIDRRSEAEPLRLVNHDLHYENVIRDWDANWVCVDPKPVIGAPEYAIAPLIWRRYRGPEDSVERVRQLCVLAGLDRPLAFDWLLVRTIEYLFWALGVGLTTDPEICRELIGHLTS